MIIKTKNYRLRTSTYVWLAFVYFLRRQWWMILLLTSANFGLFYIQWIITGVVTSILSLLYFLFWLAQFYAVTFLEENQLLFQSLSYQITSKSITMHITTKQGMPIEWPQIRRAYVRKKYIILFLSKAHFIYLPHHVFKSKQEREFLLFILRGKKLI
ncbi:MAG: YcxB family protein [Bacteroidota bacterium]